MPNNRGNAKRKISKVGDLFVSNVAKYVFYSISGRGYIFHFPFEGEICEWDSPSDYLWHITPDFCKKIIISFEPYLNDLSHHFFRFYVESAIIFYAICNNIHFTTSEYSHIFIEIKRKLLQSTISSPVILLGNKGCGISTLACAFTVWLSHEHPNWNIYYLDLSYMKYQGENTLDDLLAYMKSNHISKIRKNVIVIDSPYENSKIFEKLYLYFLNNESPYIFFLLTGRKTSINSLLENSILFNHLFPHGIFIENAETTDEFFFSSTISFLSIANYAFPSIIKRSALKHISTFYIQTIQSNFACNFTNNILNQLDYDHKTILELYADFIYICTTYMFKENKKPMIQYLPKLKMEWSEWENKCRALDLYCTKLMLSEIFPYIALFNMVNIPVTLDFIYSITGYPYHNNLLSIFFKNKGDIWYNNRRFCFRNKNVPEIYFTLHPEIKPYNLLVELATHNYMDLSTLDQYMKEIIWYPLKNTPKKVWIGNIQNLFELIQRNPAYASHLKTYVREEPIEFQWENEKQLNLDSRFEFIFTYCGL